MKIITSEILKSWDACEEGYDRFIELLPNGGVLSVCIDAAIDDKKDAWGYWLFKKCQESEDYKEQTLKGYRNAGDWNTGDWNTGDWNTGDRNTGDRNTGGWNTGSWNTGSWNTGYMNTVTPDEVLIFNKMCNRFEWDNCEKPTFIYFELNEWISEHNMTDQEKIDNPKFYVQEGFLKKGDYKMQFKKSWDNASDEDKRLILGLPNFDNEVFLEISGIDVKKELNIGE